MITNNCPNNVSVKFHNQVVEIVTEMANALMNEWGHDFPLLIKTIHNDGRSTGGGKNNHVCISDAYDVQPRKRVYELEEYASIANKKVIGTIKGDQETVLKALCAHEVAHWWHQQLLREEYGNTWWLEPEARKGYNSAHGMRWQMIYADLRTMFVNPDTKGTNPWWPDDVYLEEEAA